jgi:hypothetical protein
VRYSVARTKARVEQKSYRIYVTDSLQNIPQSKYVTRRWVDTLRPREEIDVDAIIDKVAAMIGDEDEPS